MDSELFPILSKLAEKYTAFESTSITYEKAEQLMEAILYCIAEVEKFSENTVVGSKVMSLQQAYEIGVSYVEQKAKNALNLYNHVLIKFYDYQNICLHDTVVKGLPEFFRWYDVKFAPQCTILTLDYPVLKDISQDTGIDKIYKFIFCISLEQKFLSFFPEDYVVDVLKRYSPFYKEMVENICEIVFTVVILHILVKKDFMHQNFEQNDYLQIQKIFEQMELQEIEKHLEQDTKTFVQKYYNGCEELLNYLVPSIPSIYCPIKKCNKKSYQNFLRINRTLKKKSSRF